MNKFVKWYFVLAVIFILPYTLYSFAEQYTQNNITLKDLCLDLFVEITYLEMQKEDPDRNKIKQFGIWYIEKCFDFDYSERDYYERVDEITGSNLLNEFLVQSGDEVKK